MEHLSYDRGYLDQINFDQGNTAEQHLVRYLADIVTDWGRAEYLLYLVLYDIDRSAAADWTDRFLSASNLKKKGKLVAEIVARSGGSTEHTNAMKLVLEKFDSIRDRRNLLAHGLWRRIGLNKFGIRALRRDPATSRIADEVIVDATYVGTLAMDLRLLIHEYLGCAWGLSLVGAHARRFAAGAPIGSPKRSLR